MSTTFDVLPTVKTPPTFFDVITLSNNILFKYASRHGLTINGQINVELRDRLTNQQLPINYEVDLAKWNHCQYAYFFIDNYNGGIESYFDYVDDLVEEIWIDEIELKNASLEKQILIRNGLQIGHYWSFKRYGNQSIIYDLIHGIVAGVFTELTKGVINTDDGAWDSSIFPATSEEFFASYFVLGAPMGLEFQRWTILLLESLKDYK